MADYTPFYSGGVTPFTATTSAAVTGGQVLESSGNGTVAAAGVGSVKFVGVAAHDAASGAKVSVWPLNNCVHEFVSSGAISAGAGVKCGAAGVVVTAVIATEAPLGTLVGVAMTDAASNKVRALGRA